MGDWAARKLFVRDNSAIAQRDRRDFRAFDKMPPGLQQWWRDRAEYYIKIGKYNLTDAAPSASTPDLHGEGG